MKTEIETLVVRRRGFFTVASDSREYMQSILPTEELVTQLRIRRVDIFTFLERKWCCPITEPSKTWARGEDNIAILNLKTYDEWWKNIGKKTRNMIRKADKSEIKTRVVEPSDKLAEGMWKIFNETPIRQDRGFPHYGVSLKDVKKGLQSAKNCRYIGAYLNDDLIGFVQLVQGEKIVVISQILSMQKHRDKAVNNSLVAKAVATIADLNEEWVMYGRMGNHPSLDNFKSSNGFNRLRLNRYYVLLTSKGKIAVRLGLHRELKDMLPQAVKEPLFPVYNWISRTRMRIRLLAR
jgi:hypothetical protein